MCSLLELEPAPTCRRSEKHGGDDAAVVLYILLDSYLFRCLEMSLSLGRNWV